MARVCAHACALALVLFLLSTTVCGYNIRRDTTSDVGYWFPPFSSEIPLATQNDCAARKFVFPTTIFTKETDTLYICGNGLLYGSDPEEVAPSILSSDDDVFSTKSTGFALLHTSYTAGQVFWYQNTTYYTITWCNMTQHGGGQSANMTFQAQIPTNQISDGHKVTSYFLYESAYVGDTPLVGVYNGSVLTCFLGNPYFFASCDDDVAILAGLVLRVHVDRRVYSRHDYVFTVLDEPEEWKQPESHHIVLDMDEDGCVEYKSELRILGPHPYYVHKIYVCEDGIAYSWYHNSTLLITDYNFAAGGWYVAVYHANLTNGAVYIDDNDGNLTITWANMLHVGDTTTDDGGSGDMAPAMFYDMDESHTGSSITTDEISFQLTMSHKLEADGSIRMAANYHDMNTTNVDTHLGKKGHVGVYSTHGGLFCYSGTPDISGDCETQTFQSDFTLEIKTFPHSSNEWPAGGIAGLVIAILFIITIVLCVRRNKAARTTVHFEPPPQSPVTQNILFHVKKVV